MRLFPAEGFQASHARTRASERLIDGGREGGEETGGRSPREGEEEEDVWHHSTALARPSPPRRPRARAPVERVCHARFHIQR